MTLVAFADVVKAASDTGQLQGYTIEVPKAGGRIDSELILVFDWVVGCASRAVTPEVVHDDKVLQGAPIDVRRPDVVAAFPDASEAELSGFRTTVTVPNRGESELLVQAVLQEEGPVPLGVIRARQRRRDEEREQRTISVWTLGEIFRRVLGRGGG
jgi:hypothetical protein